MIGVQGIKVQLASTLRFAARKGRFGLLLGLAAGVLLPDVAMALRPWLAELVLLLLFFSSFRIGGSVVLQGIKAGGEPLKIALILQLVLPLLALGVLTVLGVADSTFALAVLLMLSAPSVTGSPNFTILMGHKPEPAFRLLLIGTAILPITMIPIFWLTPGLGDLGVSILSALKLLVSILCAVGLAFWVRKVTLPDISEAQTQAIDGLLVILLAVIVIGLMSSLGPALIDTPLVVLSWLGLAFVLNLGLQTAAYFVFKWKGMSESAVPYAVVAGNRNFALFLLALPEASVEPLLIFLGCYQIPMYLTPLIMQRLYKQ